MRGCGGGEVDSVIEGTGGLNGTSTGSGFDSSRGIERVEDVNKMVGKVPR